MTEVHRAIGGLLALVFAFHSNVSVCAQCQTTALTGGLSFGLSVAAEGEIVVVGAPAFPTPGRVHMYRCSDGACDLLATIAAPIPRDEDSFGHSVAMHGGYLVVGAPGVSELGINAGSVHVYRVLETTVALTATLTASDGHPGDRYGWSVAIDGGTLVVGARDDTVNGVVQAGAAYVLQLKDQDWGERQKLSRPTPSQLDLFGVSVAVANDVVLVGAHGVGGGIGAAYLFRARGEWEFETELVSDEPGSGTWFGFSVDMEDQIAMVGAHRTALTTGAAYVFERSGTGWHQTEKLTALDGEQGDWFGRSVHVSPGRMFVGASHDDAPVDVWGRTCNRH